MKRRNHKKNLLLSILIFIMLVIGIGYAYLTSNLSISGVTEIGANTWNIHFENLNVTTGGVTAVIPAKIDANQLDITYSIKLERPKDYYEFTVDIKNDGTLPGKVSVSTISGLTSEAQSIVDYSITYTNGKVVTIGDILNAGAKKTIRVRVFYKDDITSENLLSDNVNLSLTYTLQYIQSDKEELNAANLLQQLSNSETCITKYEGNVTDQVGQTVPATNIYFDKCANKRNIIFNDMCWQAIRTTESGGLKILYNGKPLNNMCSTSRNANYALGGYSGGQDNLNANYLYGRSFIFDYNNTSNYFILTDTISGTWSDSNYQDFIGTFTCKKESGKCNSIYSVNGYLSSTSASTASIYSSSLGDYSTMAYNAFNAHYTSPAMAGYMFNKVYKENIKYVGTTEYKYGNSFVYDSNTNNYSLSGTTQSMGIGQSIPSWSNGFNKINDTHYTCWNTSGSCNTLSYIYYTNSSAAYYIELTEGKNINDALNEMLYDNNVNNYNSTMKGVVDSWFKQHMLNRIFDLEDVIFCNDRTILSYGGWNPNGGDSTLPMTFKNYNTNNDLSCMNITDQLSVSNNVAKLKYPVSLITKEEVNNLGNGLHTSRDTYWLLSPYKFDNGVSVVDSVNGNQWVKYARGVRPIVSLNSSAIIISGTGSEIDPWIIE